MIDTANYIHQHPGLLDLNLQGMWISDRKCLYNHLKCLLSQRPLASITWDVVHQQIPILKFVKKYESVFALKYAVTLTLLHLILVPDLAHCTVKLL